MQETAQSDVRSLSVDPGSLEDQLSSQESTDGVSGGEGVVAGEGGKKKGEHSRGTGDSLIVIGSTTAKVPALLKPNVSELRGSATKDIFGCVKYQYQDIMNIIIAGSD